jgi:hypothetical protein
MHCDFGLRIEKLRWNDLEHAGHWELELGRGALNAKGLQQNVNLFLRRL